MTARRGASFLDSIQYTGKNFTDYTFICHVRSKMDNRLVCEITPNLQSTNILHYAKSEDQTSVIMAGTYKYDVIYFNGDDNGRMLLQHGDFIVTDGSSIDSIDVLSDDDGAPIDGL